MDIWQSPDAWPKTKRAALVSRTIALLFVLLSFVALAGAGPRRYRGRSVRRPYRRVVRRLRGAVSAPVPRMSVPAIARILGVRVGYNGQDALQRQFGKGLATVGRLPNGRKTWLVRDPLTYITTDGVLSNPEGLALESLTWGLDPPMDKNIPFARTLPSAPGWIGAVVPGMRKNQVSALTSRLLPKPVIKGDCWTWTDKGFVRPSGAKSETYTVWTAQLTFDKNLLTTIDVACRAQPTAALGR